MNKPHDENFSGYWGGPFLAASCAQNHRSTCELKQFKSCSSQRPNISHFSHHCCHFLRLWNVLVPKFFTPKDLPAKSCGWSCALTATVPSLFSRRHLFILNISSPSFLLSPWKLDLASTSLLFQILLPQQKHQGLGYLFIQSHSLPWCQNPTLQSLRVDFFFFNSISWTFKYLGKIRREKAQKQQNPFKVLTT